MDKELPYDVKGVRSRAGWRGSYTLCVLMERDGTHKYVEGCTALDMSIYADCFVVIGMAAYANASGDYEAYRIK